MAEVETSVGLDMVEPEVTVQDVIAELMVTSNCTIEEPRISVQQPPVEVTQGQKAVRQRMVKPELAVCLRNASKSYGRGANILNNLNMAVPKGSIYGLLGPSGCGKTTLLRCVVGLLDLNHGEVSVFGCRPGTKGSGVPGPRVGYMPQEVALVNEFDVRGVIYYFGWLFGMTHTQIKERYDFLAQLLQLPPGGQFVKDLSGGQQRRVSFAAALVQSPELLILDEPTVGLDPVLRQSIWDYLVEISRDNNTTIIITTHYIEEAKQAHMIGLLRHGTLLAEASPTHLLRQHNTLSLEEVFLTLSKKQAFGNDNLQPITVQVHQGAVQESSSVEADPLHAIPLVEANTSTSKPHVPRPVYRKSYLITMKALLFKNFTRLLNTYGGLFFLFVFPFLEFAIFFTAVGKDPVGLRIGIVNDELGNCNVLAGDLDNYSGVSFDKEQDLCLVRGLSCSFMDALDEGYTIDNIYFDDLESALAATRKGYTAGTVHIPANFSIYLEQRIRDGKDSSDEAINNSEVAIWLDMADFTGLAVRKHFYSSYETFADQMSDGCKLPRKLTHIPMLFNEPIYGSNNPIYTYFLAPGIIVSMIFFVCTTLTISIVAVDRNEKSWDRNLVAGVTSTEIVISHLIAQSVCLISQMVQVLCLGFFVFHMQCKGNVADMLLLVFLQGLSGIAFGMLISVGSKNLTTAAYIGMGSFYPFILSSGMLWPIEGMPTFLRYISACLPSTWATTSLRNILDRGWGTLHPQVYPGLLVPTAWILAQTMLCMVVLRNSK